MSQASGVSGGASARVIDGSLQANHAAAANDRAPQSLLPSPLAALADSSDVGAQIAALLIESAHEQKAAAHETRVTAEAAQCAADERELSAMKREADQRLVAGLAEGCTKMVSGAIGVAGARASKAAGQMTAKGAAAVVEGAGRAFGALATHEADMSKRDGTAAGQISGREKRAVDDARDLDRDAKALLERALGYYKEYLTAKNDTQKAAVLRA